MKKNLIGKNLVLLIVTMLIAITIIPIVTSPSVIEKKSITKNSHLIDFEAPHDTCYTQRNSYPPSFKRGPSPAIIVTVRAVADEEFRAQYGDMWVDFMVECIEQGDDAFEQLHEIDFQVISTGSWDSNDGTSSLQELFDELGRETSKENADVLIGFTGQKIGDYIAMAGYLGDTVIITTGHPDILGNMIQHELSHLFGCPDHRGFLGPCIYCVMSYTWYPLTNRWCLLCNVIY